MIRRVAAGLCFLALAGATTRAEESARSVGDEINTIRWREDYSFRRDRPELTLLERLKFIPLNERETVYLTLGGEVRERAEDYNLAFFGLRGGTSFASYGTRLLADAAHHVGPRFPTFLELAGLWAPVPTPAPLRTAFGSPGCHPVVLE